MSRTAEHLELEPLHHLDGQLAVIYVFLEREIVDVREHALMLVRQLRHRRCRRRCRGSTACRPSPSSRGRSRAE